MGDIVIPSELVKKIDSELRRSLLLSKDLLFKVSINGPESEDMMELSRRSRYTGIKREELERIKRERYELIRPVYEHLRTLGMKEGKDFFYCDLVCDVVANLTRNQVIEVARIDSVSYIHLTTRKFPSF